MAAAAYVNGVAIKRVLLCEAPLGLVFAYPEELQEWQPLAPLQLLAQGSHTYVCAMSPSE